MPRLLSSVFLASSVALAVVGLDARLSPVGANGNVHAVPASSPESLQTFSRFSASPLFAGQEQRISYSVGSPVDVLWNGRWYPARVRAVIGPGQWLITYTGYSSAWDEVVGSNRIRWPHSPSPSSPSPHYPNSGSHAPAAAPCGFGSTCGAVPLNANPTGLFGAGTW
jgi:hypothetical protein